MEPISLKWHWRQLAFVGRRDGLTRPEPSRPRSTRITPALTWKWFDQEVDDEHPVAITRRRFLFLGAAAGVTLATTPLHFLPASLHPATNPLWTNPLRFSTMDVDQIFKNVYADYISEQLRGQQSFVLGGGSRWNPS